MSNCLVPTKNPIILDLTSSYGSLLAGSWLACAMWEWRVLIHQYGRIEGLEEMPPEILHHIWVETIVIVIVQLYFIRRIYLFSKQAIHSKIQKYTTVGIVVIMTMLSSWQLVVVFGRTMRMVYRLITVIVLSGTFTAVTATVALVLVKIYPTALYYSIVEFSLCSLYFSTLLANLNARAHIQSPDGMFTVSAFSAARRSRENDTLALGSLTPRHDGVSVIAGTTAEEIQVKHERNIKTDNQDV
ncbi:hypothetical protein F5146DRAFT_1176787 [Armillaria mellea]|nr:hypothetical protein F5146DRAFT_1176787 [Armillaria mellea]